MTFELIKKRFLGMCINYIGGSCIFEEEGWKFSMQKRYNKSYFMMVLRWRVYPSSTVFQWCCSGTSIRH